MHCRTCSYSLFNLREPRCPECGTGFDLRGYRFKPGTVAFACIHCDSLHAGEGPNYLPGTGDTVVCQSCGLEMPTPSMRVVPLVPLEQAEALNADIIPWEERPQLSFFKAWWRTLMMSIGSPSEIGKRITESASLANAYGFAFWIWFPGIFFLTAIVALFFVVLFFAVGGSITVDDILTAMGIVLGLIVLMFGVPLLVMLLVGFPAHLCLRLWKSAKHPVRCTLVASLYGTGPNITSVVFMWFCLCWMFMPCGGFLVFLLQLWSLIATIFVVQSLHQVSGLRATVAVLWFPTLLCLLWTALLFVSIAY